STAYLIYLYLSLHDALPILIVMNTGLITFVQSDMYVDMVNIFFTIVFISIGLTSTSKQNAPSSKEIAMGSLGMGIIWNIFYTLTDRKSTRLNSSHVSISYAV